MLRDRLCALLDTKLTWREREILKLRYGLGDGYNYTLEPVADIFQQLMFGQSSAKAMIQG